MTPWAVRTCRWRYIRTYSPQDPSQLEFEELYDLKNDPMEMKNLAGDARFADRLRQMKSLLARQLKQIAAKSAPQRDHTSPDG